mgnify:CR=1 FL=1
MKKFILSMAAVAALTFSACGDKNATATADSAANATATDAAAATAVEQTVDQSAATDAVPATDAEAASLLDKIKGAATIENVKKGIDYVKTLVSSGKLAEAKSYLGQIKPYADKVGLTGAIETVSETINKAEAAVGVKDKAEAAKQQATDAVQAAKDKAADAANALKGLKR